LGADVFCVRNIFLGLDCLGCSVPFEGQRSEHLLGKIIDYTSSINDAFRGHGKLLTVKFL
jgi:hypothetical protein